MPMKMNLQLLLGWLLACCSGCSCSRIPESPPGPGPIGEIRNVQTGELIQASPAPDSTLNSPAPDVGNQSANSPPRPITPQTSSGNSAVSPEKTKVDTLPGGLKLKFNPQ